ncbi:Piso0_005349 [Millerozyma farinosa CBS 7064]|uniref:Transcription factor n=1 Tax=Pichia sorbitophila (strain ATCC MYA-4447 / BCRC 22081 / CBS 7064 / NBRC 10061 / NRRL Y-12695) TaxID=559304 RepID=G8Y4V9_PICSO|nr:Piso0_005349 [Millerozyma farinosa CBS 7064]
MVKRSTPKGEENFQQPFSSTSSSNQSGSNDFVKKLFQMLQEDSYKDIVRWTTNGDSFVVINTNEFTKEILPRHFKHSNFASFVRQLNKYDFHKVKIPNEEKQFYEYGEDAWEFKHPDFRVNDREALENIKRKGPTTKKINQAGLSSSGASCGVDNSAVQQLRDDLEFLTSENGSLKQEISILNTKYKALVENIVSLRSFDERYYHSMNVLLNCLVQAGIKLPPLDFPNPALMNMQSAPTHHVPPQQHGRGKPLQHLSPPILSPNGSGNHQSIQPFDRGIMGQPSQSGYGSSQIHQPSGSQRQTGLSSPSAEPSNAKVHSPQQMPNTAQSPLMTNTGSLNAPSGQVGPNISSSTSPDNPTQPSHGERTQSHPDITTTDLANPKFHVLLVEDDNVCIQLCRKFLMKYGCQVTVATDGLNAISTVEHTKYDLVLMDIVMPNLDGATATSVIRSFDTKTPIIAMTGNIEDNDLVTYLQNGMSDILAKPFTKDDLYSILSKHLLTNSDNGDAVSGRNDVTGLQGPAQQTLILPQETQQSTHPGLNDPIVKKQRMS